MDQTLRLSYKACSWR